MGSHIICRWRQFNNFFPSRRRKASRASPDPRGPSLGAPSCAALPGISAGVSVAGQKWASLFCSGPWQECSQDPRKVSGLLKVSPTQSSLNRNFPSVSSLLMVLQVRWMSNLIKCSFGGIHVTGRMSFCFRLLLWWVIPHSCCWAIPQPLDWSRPVRLLIMLWL